MELWLNKGRIPKTIEWGLTKAASARFLGSLYGALKGLQSMAMALGLLSLLESVDWEGSLRPPEFSFLFNPLFVLSSNGLLSPEGWLNPSPNSESSVSIRSLSLQVVAAALLGGPADAGLVLNGDLNGVLVKRAIELCWGRK